MIDLAHKKNIKVLFDACQRAPHMKIDVKKMGCDFLAFSGHKMFGPTGVGVLFGKEEILEKMDPYQTGGGIIENVTMESSTWTHIPYRFEPGSPMAAQAIALSDAIEYLNKFLSLFIFSISVLYFVYIYSIRGFYILHQILLNYLG